MAILRSNGVLIVDAIPTHEPVDNQAVLAFNPLSGAFYHYDGSLPWNTIGFALADGDKGDIVVSGGGTVWTIDAGVVTLAMLADIGTSRVVGRYSAGTGEPEELSLTTDLEITAGGVLRTTAFTGDVTKAAGGVVTTVANDAISNAKLANMATDTIKGRDTAGSGDPEDLTLDSTLEFTGTGSIRRAAIGGDVTIAAGSNTSLIPDDTITYAKMQPVSATDRLLGRVSPGAGNVEEIVFTDFAQSILDDTDEATFKATVNLEIGTDVQAYDSGLAALAAFNTNGLLVQTANNTFAGRTVTGTANEITVTNGDGVSGNPTLSLPTDVNLSSKTTLTIPTSAAPSLGTNGNIALDTTVTDMSHGVLKFYGNEELAVIAVPVAELTGMVDGDVIKYNAAADEFQISADPALDATLVSLAAFNTNGILTQTAADTFAGRTITGTSNEIEVSNGDGVAGNPVLSLPSTVDLSSKTYFYPPETNGGGTGLDGTMSFEAQMMAFSHYSLRYAGIKDMIVLAIPMSLVTSAPVNYQQVIYNADDNELNFVDFDRVTYAKLNYTQTGVGNLVIAGGLNTTGSVITPVRGGVGDYELGFSGTPLTAGRTFVTISIDYGSTAISAQISWTSTNKIQIATFDATGAAADIEGGISITVDIYA